MKWQNSVVTAKGRELISSVLNGGKMAFTHAKIGEGNIDTENLSKITDVMEPIDCNIAVTAIEPISDNESTVIGTKIKTSLTNIGITEDKFIRQLGIFAKKIEDDTVKSQDETATAQNDELIVILQDPDGEYLPEYTAATRIELEFNVIIAIDKTENIRVIIPEDFIVTVRTFNDVAAQELHKIELVTNVAEGDTIVILRANGEIKQISADGIGGDDKMDKANPEGIGSFSMGRTLDSEVGTYSFVCGYAGEASGIVSHVEGSRNIASGAHAHAEGTDTVASGANSHSQGSHTTASGSGSHAAGMMTEAIGHNSHASGLRTIARRNCETVVGKYNLDYKAPEGEVEDPDKALLFAVGNGTAEDERSNAFEVREDGGARVAGVLQIDNGLTVGNRKSESTVGSNSIVLGVNCEASGKYSYAEGEETAAKGNFAAHAEGKNTTAEGDFSHAEGYKTTASGNGAHAEGSYFTDITDSSGNVIYNEASGRGSHVEGCNNISSANAAHAEGCTTKALEVQAHAEGLGTIASGLHAHAEGHKTIASGIGAHAEGSYFTDITDSSGNVIYNEASGRGSHVEGCNNISSANAAHAEGVRTIASEKSSHAEGNRTTASGDGAHAEGSYFNNITDSSGNIIYNEASGRGSHVEGCNNISSANAAHAEGCTTKASNDQAHAEGLGTIASGKNSHAEGNKTIASGTESHAEGCETKAVGKNSHAEGWITRANGEFNHTEGIGTSSSGTASHAEGCDCKAIGNWGSHAEGYYNIANGSFGAHAEGCETKAVGDNSHAEGYNTKADKGAHAEGYYTVASGEFQHVSGRYNIADTSNQYAVIVGNSGGKQQIFSKNGLNIKLSSTPTEIVLDNEININQQGIYELSTNIGLDGKNRFILRYDDSKKALYDSTTYFDITISSTKVTIVSRMGDYLTRMQLDLVCEEPSNAYTLDWKGNGWFAGAVTSTGADYAEYIKPWYDGNVAGEDRTKYFVTVKDGYLVKANDGDYIVGITSTSPAIIGNNVNTGDHDNWSCVGMIGVLPLRDDGTCVAGGFAKCGENGIATAAEAWECHKTFFVIERINDNVISVEMR